MSKAKARGTAWETDIVRLLRESNWPNAERRTMSGTNDKGDINLHPKVVIEAKNHGTLKFSEWLAEAETERRNADAHIGVVWAKRRGKAKAEDGYIVMDADTFLFLLEKAGYTGQ